MWRKSILKAATHYLQTTKKGHMPGFNVTLVTMCLHCIHNFWEISWYNRHWLFNNLLCCIFSWSTLYLPYFIKHLKEMLTVTPSNLSLRFLFCNHQFSRYFKICWIMHFPFLAFLKTFSSNHLEYFNCKTRQARQLYN